MRVRSALLLAVFAVACGQDADPGAQSGSPARVAAESPATDAAEVALPPFEPGAWHADVEWPLAFRMGIPGQYDYELELHADGTTRWTSSECYDELGDGDGAWRERAPGEFEVERHDGVRLRLFWVSWGPRRYLVSDHNTDVFLRMVDDRREPAERESAGWTGFDFVCANDGQLPVTGEPVFPLAALDVVGEQHVHPPTGEGWTGPGGVAR